MHRLNKSPRIRSSKRNPRRNRSPGNLQQVNCEVRVFFTEGVEDRAQFVVCNIARKLLAEQRIGDVTYSGTVFYNEKLVCECDVCTADGTPSTRIASYIR